jgi:hypothetical protein
MDEKEKKPKKLEARVFTCGFDDSKNKEKIKKTILLKE